MIQLPANIPTGRALADRRRDTFAMVSTHFAAPDTWFAPHAFYFYTGDLASADLTDQATRLMEKRFNPGYVQMRQWPGGYWMKDEWFDGLRKTVEAAHAGGGYACYTGGDPCVPEHPMLERYPDLASVSLRCVTVDAEFGESVDVSVCFFAVSAQLDASSAPFSDTLTVIAGGSSWSPPARGSWRVYRFSKYHLREPEGLDLNFLDKRAGQAWIEVEHDIYANRMGDLLGGAIPGGFIDLEGDYGVKLAYSDDLAAEYERQTGRDIRLWMPLLIDEDAEGLWAKARWDWFNAVSTTYIDSFIAPLDRWFDKHGMYMTCHFWEENLVAQAMRTGNYFAAQRAYSLPGTDSLFMGALRPRDFKETQAVAEFEGRQLMCELLGVAGWHVSPADLRNATNCAIAWGVTHVVLHGVGCERDLRRVSYPPDFFDWNPYWTHFELYSDYCARASFISGQGRSAADTLLLCPMDSVWSLLGDGLFDADRPYKTFTVDQQTGSGEPECSADMVHATEVNAIEVAYTQAMADLAAARVEYLIADTEYMRQMQFDGPTLTRGEFAFATIILPPLVVLPLDVAEKLVSFAEAGGAVVTLGGLPDGSTDNGRNDPQMTALMARLAASPNTVAAPNGLAALANAPASPLRAHVEFDSCDFPLIQQHRIIDGRDFYWLVNATASEQTCTLLLPGQSGGVTIWDCETGHRNPLPSTTNPAGVTFTHTFAPHDAFWLVVEPDALAVAVAIPQAAITIALDGEWRVWFDPSGQPDPAQHGFPVPEWITGDGALRHLQSWLEWDMRSFTGFVDYEKRFTLDTGPTAATLDLGDVKHIAEVTVNGRTIGARLWAPFRFEIASALREGENIVHVRVGNLLVNAVTQYEDYNWKWHGEPTDETLTSGLMGPVTLTL
ncbi:MAG TPA: glycosyl hydrolase [Capsulimonadaceae bacterium]|jgi:hypothetical protein